MYRRQTSKQGRIRVRRVIMYVPYSSLVTILTIFNENILFHKIQYEYILYENVIRKNYMIGKYVPIYNFIL